VWLAAWLLLAGCASAPPAQAPPPGAPAAAGSPALPADLEWVRDSAEFRAAVLQAYRVAGAHVEAQAASRAPGTWAVTLDADETVIGNVQYQIEQHGRGMKFGSETWDAWVRRREATALPGAGAFLTRVRALGGRIAIVTNRLVSQCADTEAVFRAHALVYDVMLCRPDGTPSDKNPRFAAVASGQAFGLSTPLDVVAYLGDNIHDFPALSQASRDQGDAAFESFGVRFFLVPNPMYGSWQ
jgi:5'-nucleotidase (lipoprotein e(P4) family)